MHAHKKAAALTHAKQLRDAAIIEVRDEYECACSVARKIFDSRVVAIDEEFRTRYESTLEEFAKLSSSGSK